MRDKIVIPKIKQAKYPSRSERVYGLDVGETDEHQIMRRVEELASIEALRAEASEKIPEAIRRRIDGKADEDYVLTVIHPRTYDAMVDPVVEGGDYTTIEAALNAGEKSIFIKSGTYTPGEDLVCNDGQVIIGESRKDVIINFGTTGYGLKATGSGGSELTDIRIASITLQSSDTGISEMIDFDYCDRTRIQNCNFEIGAGGSNVSSAYLNHCDDSSIVDCVAKGTTPTQGLGFRFLNSLYSTVRGCVAKSVAYGFYLYGSQHCTFIGNVAIGCNRGLYAVSGEFSAYYANTVRDCTLYGIQISNEGHGVIVGNVSYNNTEHGIIVDVSGDDTVSIVGNYSYGNAKTGIYVVDANHANITGNVALFNQARAGIELWNCNHCLVSSNVSSRNESGAEVIYGIRINSNCDGNEIRGNRLYNNYSGSILDEGTNTVYPFSETDIICFNDAVVCHANEVVVN